MKHRVVTIAASAMLVLAGQSPTRATEKASPGSQVHNAHGIVREIAPDRSKAVIRHDAIADYMPAMTMEFNVRDSNQLAGVAVGDTVTFRLSATDETHWIDDIRKVASGTNSAAPAARLITAPNLIELKPGDTLPDYKLTTEDGRQVHFSDFRGRALALTFFFTRCPVPDFCPRMGNNLAAARRIILGTPNSPTNWQFLSISFDPEFDQPAVLARYANFYRTGNPDRWLFAVASTNVLAELAPRLDLIINRDAGGGISHNLRTVVVDGLGRIHRQFDGNQWTADDLAREVVSASAVGAKSTEKVH